MFFHFSLALSLSPALTLTHSLHQHYVHITKLKIPIALQNVQYCLEVAVLFPPLRSLVLSVFFSSCILKNCENVYEENLFPIKRISLFLFASISALLVSTIIFILSFQQLYSCQCIAFRNVLSSWSRRKMLEHIFLNLNARLRFCSTCVASFWGIFAPSFCKRSLRRSRCA